MFLGGIPLVTIPVIIRIFLVKAVHVVITIGLCQNGGGSDGKVLPVSFHYGRMRQVPIFFKAVAVYQQMLRTDIQLVNSTVHGKKGGIENIDFVNFFSINDAK